MLSTLAHRALERDGLGPIRDKVLAGERLTEAEALAPLRGPRPGRAGRARQPRARGSATATSPSTTATSTSTPPTSAWPPASSARSPARTTSSASEGYTMSLDAGGASTWSRSARWASPRCTSSPGCTPTCPGSTTLETHPPDPRRPGPSSHIKAFTAVELPLLRREVRQDATSRCCASSSTPASTTIPGGGAEIFAPRVRRKICDDKATAEQWLEVHRTAHRLGLKSNATMLYGHIETAGRAGRPHAPAARAAGRDRRLPGLHPARLPPRAQHDRQGLPEAHRLRRPAHLRGGAALPRQLRPREGVLGVAGRAARPGRALLRRRRPRRHGARGAHLPHGRRHHAAGALRGPAAPHDPLRRARARPSATASTTCCRGPRRARARRPRPAVRRHRR